MQAETVEAVSTLSEQEHERKAQATYIVDASIRERMAARRENQKHVRGPRGIWSEEPSVKSLGVSKYITSDGTKSLMKDRKTSGFELLVHESENNHDLESKLMLTVTKTQTDLSKSEFVAQHMASEGQTK